MNQKHFTIARICESMVSLKLNMEELNIEDTRVKHEVIVNMAHCLLEMGVDDRLIERYFRMTNNESEPQGQHKIWLKDCLRTAQ